MVATKRKKQNMKRQRKVKFLPKYAIMSDFLCTFAANCVKNG